MAKRSQRSQKILDLITPPSRGQKIIGSDDCETEELGHDSPNILDSQMKVLLEDLISAEKDIENFYPNNEDYDAIRRETEMIFDECERYIPGIPKQQDSPPFQKAQENDEITEFANIPKDLVKPPNINLNNGEHKDLDHSKTIHLLQMNINDNVDEEGKSKACVVSGSSLVPYYDISSSDDDTRNDNPIHQVTRRKTSSLSNSSSSDSSSSSSDTDSSSSSAQSGTETIHEERPASIRNSTITDSESDVDLSDNDPSFSLEQSTQKKKRNYFFPSENTSSSPSDFDDSENADTGRKRRKKGPEKWKQQKSKRLRNTGESYTSRGKKTGIVPGRVIKSACTKCKHKCSENFDTEKRYELFTQYWNLGDIYRQRAYLNTCMTEVEPKYRYTNTENPRLANIAYYFTDGNKRIRVCKIFFRNTLDILNRAILTAREKKDKQGFLKEDLRGKHKNHKKLSPELVEDIKAHINSIPKIESHYVRATSNKKYIDGAKTIKDLHKDFDEQQKKNGKPTAKYLSYYKIFTTDFNIAFHQPKKDQCDLCLSYANSNTDQRKTIEDKYQSHLREKNLSRIEKMEDRKKITATKKVAVYDLQAVLQCPRGESSAFYYKSKLNSYNLTVTELNKKETKKSAYDNVHCYFWTESDAKRGANEIGSCVWKYLEEVCRQTDEDVEIIFYSDNCCGQNKNKFITALYMFTVSTLNIRSITHKFLIRGHTQNEADSVHSLIEKEVKRNLRSGPIYIPHQYVTLIKNAKKSPPHVNVHELTYNSFLNLKELQEEWGYNFTVNEEGETVIWNEIKILNVRKESPLTFYYKKSYADEEYSEVNVRNKRKKMKRHDEIVIGQLYDSKQTLSDNKVKGIKELLDKELIPSYYANFYDSIFN